MKKLIRKSSLLVVDCEPGESCLFFKGFDYFDDVRGVPCASILRHPSAMSLSWWLVLTGSGGNLPLGIRRCFATACQKYGNALHERCAGTNAYACSMLGVRADADADADIRLCPPSRRNASLLRHLCSGSESFELIEILI